MIAKCSKQFKCLLKVEWMDILWCISTFKYYTMKRNEQLLHSIMWMNFTNIMLSKRSQTKMYVVWFSSIKFKKQNESVVVDVKVVVTFGENGSAQ